MTIPRKHHYLPQFYLRGFASGKNQVWMFDLASGIHAPIAVRDAATERDLYSMPDMDGKVDHASLEQRFSDEVEAPVAPVLKAVLDKTPISRSDKEHLSRFVYTFFSRVPSGRDRLRAQAPHLAKQVLGNAIARIDPSLPEDKRAELIRAGNEIANFQAEHPPKEAMLPLDHGRVVPHLMAMRFVFVEVAKGFQFVTSDSPFAFDTSTGISGSDFTLPLCSDLALIGTHSRVVQDLTYHFVPGRIGREINLRTIRSANRFVYSRSRQGWLNQASKSPHSFRRTMW
ncbi:DUF4238 domain-containing protein [Rhodothermus sp. AH-315-K08]|nr:DUF4238 domain-containing protein [Rhodothermus sp. AH-315-K08]